MPQGGKSWGRECRPVQMKDNAINKIYKITNNALGISLIVTRVYYAEHRFMKLGHFGSLH